MHANLTLICGAVQERLNSYDLLQNVTGFTRALLWHHDVLHLFGYSWTNEVRLFRYWGRLAQMVSFAGLAARLLHTISPFDLHKSIFFQ